MVLHDPDLERVYDVPGTPFLLVMDELGMVRAKGTVNNLEQVEGLVDLALRRIGGGAGATGQLTSIERAERASLRGPADVGSSASSAGAWSRWREAVWSRPRSRPSARPHTRTSAVIRSRPTSVRIRSVSSRGPTRSGTPSTRSTATPSTTMGEIYTDPATQSGARSVNSGWRIPPFREGPAVRRWLDAMLQRSPAPYPGLLLDVAHPDQRRRIAYRLLPDGPPRLLHHLPGARGVVLDGVLLAALVSASAIAGWSALHGP